MSAWQPSRAVTQLILDFGRRFRASLPRQVGADELIPGQVVALDPYDAGAIPRYVRVALHSGYRVDAYWRGSPAIIVGSDVVVVHFRKGDRYEILLAGGDSGLAPAGFPRRPALWHQGELTEYATIQQAINAATAGDTIFVPPGNYEETLTIEKDINLVGLGAEEGVTISAGNIDQPWVITSPCRVRNMAFRHSVSSRTGITMSGIYINASGQVRLEGIFINPEVTASPDPDYSAVYVNSGSLNARHLRINGTSSGTTLGLTGINVHAGSSSIDQFTIQIDSAGGGIGILTDTGGSLVIYNGSIDVSASTPYSIYSSGNTSVYACRYDPNQVYGSLIYLEGDMPTWTEMDSRYVNEGQAGSISADMLQGNIPSAKLADGACLEEILDDDGAGSGLDADMVDGEHLSDLDARYVNASGDSMTGKLTAPSYGSRDTRSVATAPGDYDAEMRLQFKYLFAIGLDGIASGVYCQLMGYRAWIDDTGGRAHELAFTDGGYIYYRNGTEAAGWGPWQKLWHAGNDGAGSGLDADLLDGKHASAFVTGQGAGVRRTTAQNIPSNTWTFVSFDTEDWDSDNCWSPSEPTRLYCRTAGIYVISAAIRWVANGNGIRVVHLRRNGGIVRGTAVPTPFPTYSTRQDINDILSMSAGDFIELAVYQTSGANLNLEPYDGREIELAMARIG